MNGIEVKICGLTSRHDAVAALDLGADYLGFVLYGKSPRGIAAAELSRILDRIEVPCKAVGVFVNELRGDVASIASDCGLHAVQIHGDEEAEEFADMPVPVWRAVWCRAGRCSPEPGEWQAERYVVDTAAEGSYGGTGVRGDWQDAARLASEHPVMLAGGLRPGNVREAILAVNPMGVDVASGVESAPGKKDHVLLAQFIRAAKAAKGEHGSQTVDH